MDPSTEALARRARNSLILLAFATALVPLFGAAFVGLAMFGAEVALVALFALILGAYLVFAAAERFWTSLSAWIEARASSAPR